MSIYTTVVDYLQTVLDKTVAKCNCYLLTVTFAMLQHF